MDSSENSYWWKLPVDIQAYILTRFNGKTLITLKLVSWDWYHMISHICITTFAPPSPDAAFCGFIYRRQGEGLRLIPASRFRHAALIRTANTFRVSYKGITDRLRQLHQSEEIQDCCNGILLVVSHDKDGGVSYSVFNPTTGERLLVPRPPLLTHDYHIHNDTTRCCFASLAFHPTKSLHFKIICTLGGNITNPLNVEMFSSETGKWSRNVVGIDSKLDGVEWIHHSAYLDGRLYRLLNANYLLCIEEGKTSKPLRVHAIGLPNGSSDDMYIDGDNCHGSIGISMRRLHYSTRDRNRSTLLVYMLNDDAGWLLKYTIPIDDLVSNQSEYFFQGVKRIVNKYRNEAWFNFYAFHPNCDRLYLATPRHMLYYSPKQKSLEMFHYESAEHGIVFGQNYIFACSHCPVTLRSAFQRASCAKLDHRLSVTNLDQPALEVIDEVHDPCLVNDENLKVTDELLDLKDLQNRTQAIEKTVMEMERRVRQENSNAHSQLEAALRDIDALKSESRFHRLHIKPKSEISEADNPLLTKDIMLDQISECSSYGVSRRELVNVDNEFVELWETADPDHSTGPSFYKVKKIVAPTPEIVELNRVPSTWKKKTRFPSSGSLTEKEFGVDKLEVITKPVDSQEGNSRKILRRPNSDVQKLTNLHITVQDLRKLETTEKSKKGKTIDESDTLKEQLEEAEATILKLFDQNGKLLKYIDDDFLSSGSKSTMDFEHSASIRRKKSLSSNGKSITGFEDSENTRNKRISDQASRISEKIGRLQLEVQKIQFILLKYDDEKQRRFKHMSESKRRVLLRDCMYGASRPSQSRRKKVTFCGCVQPATRD